MAFTKYAMKGEAIYTEASKEVIPEVKIPQARAFDNT